MRLTHVRLLVSDFDACFRFYRDVLSFEVAWSEEGVAYADFKAGDGSLVALFQRQLMAQAVGVADLPLDAPCQDRVALIFAVDDLDATVDQLRGRGVSFATEPQDRPDWAIRTAHFRDPDGNLLELYSPLRAE
ncbi:MAG: VOC family protein [Chloroflexi bacterium]|nr:VOC family protein [Chloroflexota bacterium]